MRSTQATVTASAAFLTLALALTGCTADAGEEPTATSAEALTKGGAGVSSYSCDGTFCTCTGDEDCNDMFSDGVCGAKAICQISPTDVPRCRCSVARVGGRTPDVFVRPSAGATRAP